ncbi:MAG TPA: beta-N-acetylglucosaminidase domain-containing protein [Thermoleophilaceae bacterium]|jgi:hyaluronoglucosaminidase
MRRPTVLCAALAACAVSIAPPPAAPAAPPRLEWRGIVEGPYGPPWDHAARERVLRWMPSHGFNAYVHAPKDDLWQRTQWRDPYPPERQAEFDAEVRLARARGIEWVPNLSPAVPLIPTPAAPSGAPSRDLCFACPEDLDAVLAKLEPFRAAGARTFMLSFDDVAKTLTHPQDLAAYGPGDEGFGRANGDLLSRLYGALRERTPDARLLTVGADYSGTADTAYLAGLRATLRREVGVMWTGLSVPSQEFAPEDAAAYGRAIGRRPLVWENWTNDDTAGNATPHGTARLFLGPYRRRADAAGAVGGLFFNPMNEADLNLLPLATAGDWMRDPARYERRRSWLAAVKELAGRGRDRRALFRTLRAFAEASWSTKLDLEEAPTFVRLSRAFLDRYEGGSWTSVDRGLREELWLAETAGGRLGGLPNRAIAEQARPFAEAAARAAGAGRLATELLAAERPALRLRRRGRRLVGVALPPDRARAGELRSAYRALDDASRRDDRFVYGWRTPYAFEIPPYPVPPNAMNAYLDAVGALDAAWQERADRAAAGPVAVTAGGRAVPVRASGGFRLRRADCGRLVVATDGAGGRTARRAPRCR